MPIGLAFVQSVLAGAGVLLALGGSVLLMVETAPPGAFSRSRRRLAQGWRSLAAVGWSQVPGCLTGWLAVRLDGLIRLVIAEADLRSALGGLILLLMLVLVPGAALLNALIGGSPFLFWYYLSLLTAFAFLIFAGETGRLRALTAVAAVYMGLSLMVVIPVYLVRSFTDMAIHTVFSHSVLLSVLVAVFWYVAAYGAGLVLDTGLRFAGRDPASSPWVHFTHALLAAVPVAFVLVFVALLAGHFSVYEQSPARSWQLVLSGVGMTALALPLTLTLMTWGARWGGVGLALAYASALIVAVGLSLALAVASHTGGPRAVPWSEAVNVLIGLSADGERVYLGPEFWLSHLPFVPLLLFVGAITAGLVAKGVIGALQAVAGEEAVTERPFLASAVSCAGMAALLWAAAALV